MHIITFKLELYVFLSDDITFNSQARYKTLFNGVVGTPPTILGPVTEDEANAVARHQSLFRVMKDTCIR
jgi:hypothetical protein